MIDTNTLNLQYPIGKFVTPPVITQAIRGQYIEELALAPQRLQQAVKGLSAGQLDTPYRPGGWTLRQLVHHLPDSHMNAYIRMKLALTEEVPVIKPYEEQLWAELNDTYNTPIEVSLVLFENLHSRWLNLINTLSEQSWQRSFRHPQLGVVALNELVGLYAWHGNHHIAHITTLRKQMGW